MGKYVYLIKEIDKEILIDWYINSTDEDTIWTEKHIDELLEDFVLIPKSSLKSIEEKTINDIKKQSVKHGQWIPQGDDMWLCSNCKKNIIYSEHESDRIEKQRYCCKCGARMDLGDING